MKLKYKKEKKYDKFGENICFFVCEWSFEEDKNIIPYITNKKIYQIYLIFSSSFLLSIKKMIKLRYQVF